MFCIQIPFIFLKFIRYFGWDFSSLFGHPWPVLITRRRPGPGEALGHRAVPGAEGTTPWLLGGPLSLGSSHARRSAYHVVGGED